MKRTDGSLPPRKTANNIITLYKYIYIYTYYILLFHHHRFITDSSLPITSPPPYAHCHVCTASECERCESEKKKERVAHIFPLSNQRRGTRQVVSITTKQFDHKKVLPCRPPSPSKVVFSSFPLVVLGWVDGCWPFGNPPLHTTERHTIRGRWASSRDRFIVDHFSSRICDTITCIAYRIVSNEEKQRVKRRGEVDEWRRRRRRRTRKRCRTTDVEEEKEVWKTIGTQLKADENSDSEEGTLSY